MALLIGFCVWLLSALVLWAQPDSSGAEPILSGYIWRSRARLSNWDGRAGFVANIKAGGGGGLPPDSAPLGKWKQTKYYLTPAASGDGKSKNGRVRLSRSPTLDSLRIILGGGVTQTQTDTQTCAHNGHTAAGQGVCLWSLCSGSPAAAALRVCQVSVRGHAWG